MNDLLKPSAWPRPVQWIARNILGYVLIALGVVQLFVPGQGILTILAGLAVADWPGKGRFFRWLRTYSWFEQADRWVYQRVGMHFPEHDPGGKAGPTEVPGDEPRAGNEAAPTNDPSRPPVDP